MKLIIIILGLMALRYFYSVDSGKRYTWLLTYGHYLLRFLQQKGIKNSSVLLLLLMLPLLAVLALLVGFTWYSNFILANFSVNLALFWYALQPIMSQQVDREIVSPVDKPADAIIHDELTISSPEQNRDYSKRLLIDANQNTFAVIFWFFIFGGYGAIIYRWLNVYFRHTDTALAELRTPLILLHHISDWLPAHLLAMAYVLVGDFNPGFHSWRHYAGKSLANNDELLINTGLSAIGKVPSDVSMADEAENRQLIDLIDRALIVWLFVIAVFVIGATMY